jgi:Ca2+-binding RTX toxin-like protein
MPLLTVLNPAGVDYRGAMVSLASLTVDQCLATPASADHITISLGNGQTVTMHGAFTGANLAVATGSVSGLTLSTGATVELTVTGYQGLLTVEALRGAIGAGQLFDMLNGVPYVSLGNDGNDVLGGSIFNDYINGGGGSDVMAGMTGDDVYVANSATDVIIEGVNAGYDTVRASSSYVLGDNLEKLKLTGFGRFSATGNDLDNTIIGNWSGNKINGGLGNDKLIGGGGHDQFIFSTALNAHRNVDDIKDFCPWQDVIVLSHAIFDVASSGRHGVKMLAESAFKAVRDIDTTTKLDADDKIIYDKSDGHLYYDANGGGKANGGITQFADLNPAMRLDHHDFLIIA